jgi:FKBP-type peptidyl-prolyl cis-trans isomerase FkpA
VRVIDVVSKEEFNIRMQRKNEADQAKEESDVKAYLEKNKLNPTTTPSGLMYIVKKSSDGKSHVPGDTVTVHYTGTLLNGSKFDSSVDKGTPFSFVVGKGSVIPGFDEGIMMMKVGEKFLFLMPSYLAYGSGGEPRGGIPPFSTLIFEIELLK